MTLHDAQYRYRVSRCSPLVGATPVGSLGLLGAGGGPVAGLGGGAPVLGHVVTGGGGGNSGHRGGGGSGGGSVSGPVLKIMFALNPNILRRKATFTCTASSPPQSSFWGAANSAGFMLCSMAASALEMKIILGKKILQKCLENRG